MVDADLEGGSGNLESMGEVVLVVDGEKVSCGWVGMSNGCKWVGVDGWMGRCGWMDE